MGEWDGVRERVLALGAPPYKGHPLRRLLRWPAGSFTPLLDDPLTEDEVRAAERQFGITFPADYRGFLLEVGAGGFGPGYGVASLVCRDGIWGWPEWGEAGGPGGSLLAQPFPSDDVRTRLTEQLRTLEGAARASHETDGTTDPALAAFRAAEDELYPAMTAGAVRLSHAGCGYFTWLVVTGEERGNLWFDPRCSDGPLAPLGHVQRRRTRFAEWYLEWLDELPARRA
ncbi:SMI1/KNR4 family protein [Actinacidiphila guanduensis]|uniref:SMI1-KNR4 cell-wall n=1 Tax=Actinacidiphila guanduensis TaxID=310781 RepID=A0A1H0DYK5_9ACTN|nr:SMI1/KNR4 family protein [Actinacidiphila guanduensis]SDN75264.1 SMI1-KNR4 cell-wall [Actinacidiphila guanduensis]